MYRVCGGKLERGRIAAGSLLMFLSWLGLKLGLASGRIATNKRRSSLGNQASGATKAVPLETAPANGLWIEQQ